ncbi:thioredoxin family protein [Glaciecola sp. 1036]|uniref:thioredoxin family protein n=1 Tax=Alteromonadaceae TaxID=72275 RepID=UPI003D03AF0E
MAKFLSKIALLLVVITVVFFGNRMLQGHLGQQAVKSLPFEIYNYEEGLQEAQRANKLILADYSAIWCPVCRKLDEQIFSTEQVSQKIADSFVYIRLEYDSVEGKAFAKKFDLQGFPRIIALQPDGNAITELPLVFDPVEYSNNLQKVLSSLSQH